MPSHVNDYQLTWSFLSVKNFGSLTLLCFDAREKNTLTSESFLCTLSFQKKLQILFLYGQDALKALWRVSFPGTDLVDLVSDQWKDMGWQGPNPSTDFRYFPSTDFILPSVLVEKWYGRIDDSGATSIRSPTFLSCFDRLLFEIFD